ncbi:hypothetical protein ZHAS_00010512 [Anopheles sinensis]|uniref:Uncharacterized protein n=1 Tax=Anopheles sinensis TaxID=74873 RepID=A0A084VXR7_ANOSI|nr:hypothetical protein ZHAS_00010512 [Anopheles sinensis]
MGSVGSEVALGLIGRHHTIIASFSNGSVFGPSCHRASGMLYGVANEPRR